MSKFLLLLVIPFLFSCEGDQKPPKDSVGLVRKFEPLAITVEDNDRIEAICRSLSAKEDILTVLVSTGEEYTFSYSQKSCTERSMPEAKDVVATISRTDNGYMYKAKNNEYFGFPDVETVTKGVMSEICLNSGRLMSPMLTRTGAIWFTSFTASEHCRSDANGQCLHIQKGSSVGRHDYLIHTNEWIKVRTTTTRKGFVMERKVISSANCKGSDNFVKESKLK